MKKLAVAVVISCSSFVFAGSGEWKEESTKIEKAVTPFGIKKIMNKWEYRILFSQVRESAVTKILVGEDPGIVDHVDVTTTILKWHGDTVCSPNNPRLTLKLHGYSLCWAESNGCEAQGVPMPIGFDPCS